MVHPQTAMLGWTSASVPLVLYPTYDSRHPTRTQYPGDVPPVGAMPIGHPRRLQVVPELISRLGPASLIFTLPEL